MNRPDLDIRHDVESELQWDPSIDDRRIGVIVCNGVVTLTGEVAHLTGRTAAEDITRRVKGVRAIANEIQVMIPLSGARSDTDIAAAAAAALRWNVATTSSAITPVVKEGCVTLSGNVTWGFQNLSAERAIRPLRGVRHVVNNILVTTAIKAAQVKRDVVRAL